MTRRLRRKSAPRSTAEPTSEHAEHVRVGWRARVVAAARLPAFAMMGAACYALRYPDLVRGMCGGRHALKVARQRAAPLTPPGELFFIATFCL